MIQSYVKAASRNLAQDRLITLVNLFGLSVSFAACILIALHLGEELSFDRHNLNHENIYRVVTRNANNDNVLALTSREVGPILTEENSEVLDYARLMPYASLSSPARALFRVGQTAVYEQDVYYADPSVFGIFTHELVAGDAASALSDPYSIAISTGFAEQLFGATDALGRLVTLDEEDYTVRAVFRDLPANTHLNYDVLISFNRITLPSRQPAATNYFAMSELFTYLLVENPIDAEDFRRISDTYNQRYMLDIEQRVGTRNHLEVEPLTRIHMHSTAQADRPHGNVFYSYIIAAVGVFLLFVACANYINLATAKSIRRAREVGVRKVLGASRAQLVIQFMFESVLLCWLAMVLALGLIDIILGNGLLDSLLGESIAPQALSSPGSLAGLLLLCTGVGLLSGAYPALYLSRLLPVLTLKADVAGKGKLQARELLVLIQFVVTVTVICSTLLMNQQLRFLHNQALGFDDGDVITVPITGADSVEALPALIESLREDPAVLNVAVTRHLPGGGLPNHTHMVENNAGELERQNFTRMEVGADLMETLDMTLVAGRSFDTAIPTDRTRAVIVNETAVSEMGWDDPIGKRYTFGSPINGLDGVVIGVVRDFHFQNFHEPIRRLGIHLQGDDFSYLDEQSRELVTRYLVFRVNSGQMGDVLSRLRESWPAFDPAHPFEYSLLNDSIDAQYQSESRQVALMTVFSVLAILISSFGVFGLTALATRQRTREIGIRKVLGASVYRIVSLLFERTLVTILVASVVAFVASFYLITRWIEQFAYYAEINYLIFPLSTLLTLTLAFIAVGYQSTRAASMNPVESLRCE